LALRTTNYSGLAEVRGISTTASLNLIDEMVESSIRWEKPIKIVGIDGKGVGKNKQVFNITNLVENQVIGVLPNFTQRQLKEKLLEIDIKLRLAVREVCIDMDSFFVAVIKECFPNARIVIDHFHVIQWAIKLLKDQKKIAQEVRHDKFPINQLLAIPIHRLTEKQFQKLKIYFLKEPDLKVSWKIIHQLRKVYWLKDYRQAHSQLRKVIWLCNTSKISQMKDLAKTLKRWFNEILNYYVSRTTNAYTEGVHVHFERIKRNHFGIRNINRFCKRILFCLLPLSIFVQMFVQRI
jgi:transposase